MCAHGRVCCGGRREVTTRDGYVTGEGGGPDIMAEVSTAHAAAHCGAPVVRRLCAGRAPLLLSSAGAAKNQQARARVCYLASVRFTHAST